MGDTLQGLLTEMDTARESMLRCVERAKAAQGIEVDGTIHAQILDTDPMCFQLITSLITASETYQRILRRVLAQLQPTTLMHERELWAKECHPEAVDRLEELKAELMKVKPRSRRYYTARHELETISLSLNIAWCKQRNAETAV